MLLLGIYIGGVIMAALSCWGAAMDEDGPYAEYEDLPIPGLLLGVAVVAALCLFWPVSMPWMIVDTYLKNK